MSLRYPLRDEQLEPRGPRCTVCGWVFRHRETVYQLESETLCADCLRERVEKQLETDLDSLSEKLGYSPTEYDAREGHL